MNNWKETTLGEMVTFQRGHDLPISQCNDGKYPVIGSSGIIGFHDVFTTKGPGVVIGRSGNSVGRAHYSDKDFWAHNTTLYVKKFHDFDPKFIYYFLLCYNLKYFEGGSAVPTLNRNHIHPLEFTVPIDVSEQKSISKILSSLDNKIELLQNQNKTLEKIAQTIFKHWFIDFEFPNEKDKPYESSGGKMVESDLGEIPEGWTVGELNEYVDHIKENVIPARSPKVTFSHYSIPAFDQNQIMKEDGVNILSNKYEVTKNSFLVSKLNPQTPRVWTILEPEENSVCSTEFQVIKPKKIECYSFVYSFLNSPVFSRELASKAHGTSSSHQRVKPQDIIGVGVIFPDKILIKNFQSLVFPAIKKMVSNNSQAQTLSRLRDTLLPKLMSGKLRVK